MPSTILHAYLGEELARSPASYYSWSSYPTSLQASGSVETYSTCVLWGTSDQEYTNFYVGNFNGWSPRIDYVPDDCTITGVAVTIRRKCGPSAVEVRDDEVRLLVGTTTLAHLSSDNKAIGAVWGGTYADITYGGVSDLWGFGAGVITAAVVNGDYFGAAIAAKATSEPDGAQLGQSYLDEMYFEIFYTLPHAWQCGDIIYPSDDGWAIAATTSLDDSATRMKTGKTSDGNNGLYLRLSNLDLNTTGVSLISAKLHLYDRGGGASTVYIAARNSAQASIPINYVGYWNTISGDLTSTIIPWTIPSTTDPDTVIDSPELKDLIAEILLMPDYIPSDNHVLFVIYGDASVSALHEFGTSEGIETGYLTVEWGYLMEGGAGSKATTTSHITFIASPAGGAGSKATVNPSFSYLTSATGGAGSTAESEVHKIMYAPVSGGAGSIADATLQMNYNVTASGSATSPKPMFANGYEYKYAVYVPGSKVTTSLTGFSLPIKLKAVAPREEFYFTDADDNPLKSEVVQYNNGLLYAYVKVDLPNDEDTVVLVYSR